MLICLCCKCKAGHYPAGSVLKQCSSIQKQYGCYAKKMAGALGDRACAVVLYACTQQQQQDLAHAAVSITLSTKTTSVAWRY
jgi:hypothetical protein